MNVPLSPELEHLIQEKVASGLYLSAGEVVREALQLLDERDRLRQIRLEELREEIALGIAQADQGMIAPLDMDAIRAKVQQRLDEGTETR